MNGEIVSGILIPLLGTTVGSAFALMMKKSITENVTCILSGIAAGVMTAASFWSLIVPSIEMSVNYGKLSFLPATVGFCLGVLILMYLDSAVTMAFAKNRKKSAMLFLAVTIHNIPEGMAIGAAYSAFLASKDMNSLAEATVLCLGIAIQNIPEGAIISLPFVGGGIKKSKAFSYGVLSGVVEPLASIFTIILARFAVPVLPYLLSFAAGAMIYVVIKELLPEFKMYGKEKLGIIAYTFGFCIMMCLDVSLG